MAVQKLEPRLTARCLIRILSIMLLHREMVAGVALLPRLKSRSKQTGRPKGWPSPLHYGLDCLTVTQWWEICLEYFAYGYRKEIFVPCHNRIRYS